MNGAIAELCAKTMRPPNTNSTSSIGVSHHHLLFQKKPNSSPKTPVRFTNSSKNFIGPFPLSLLIGQRRLIYQVIAQNKHIHSASSKRLKRFLGSIYDRLALVIKRGIKQKRHAGGLAESLDQSIIFRIGLLPYRLKPTCAVHMRNRWNCVSLAFFDLHDVEHETGGIMRCRVVQLKIVLS